jgi:hypothetical protein
MRAHEYKLRIEYNDHPGLHPITVTVTRHGEQLAEHNGKRLLALLNDARNTIISEEEKER